MWFITVLLFSGIELSAFSYHLQPYEKLRADC